MPSAPSTPSIACSTGPLSGIDADLLVVPWFPDDTPDWHGIGAATGGEVARAVDSKEFQSKPFDLFLAPISDKGWHSGRLALIGGGAAERGTELVRKLAAAAGYAARQKRVARAAFVVRGSGNEAALSQAAAEGLTLAEFWGGIYKTTDPAPAPPPVWTVVVLDATPQTLDAASAAVARGRILGECSNLAREMANEPGNRLTPREFAARATALASEAGVTTEILDETQIDRLGMGLLQGVARGSAEPPRVMVFRYDPPGAPATPVLGLVGKGITFDTGGISIKPAEKMEQMKDDMAGGAAVACAMRYRPSQSADSRHRRRSDDGEHAGRQGAEAGRRPEKRGGEDGRGDQHRRRRAADSRRRSVVRAYARRDAPG